MTTTRHPNSARFHELVQAIAELHDRKQADYGRGDDPFANVRASEEWGIPGWKGAMVRLNDKVVRLKSLSLNGRLMNESATDSFLDIAVYALIAHVLWEQETTTNPPKDGKMVDTWGPCAVCLDRSKDICCSHAAGFGYGVSPRCHVHCKEPHARP